jgi:prepilin-type N-terminal cleavage/methylation domain-containing protein
MTRRAFTTVELMVVLTIGGIIAGGIFAVLRRQQRFFTNSASLVAQRMSLRDATGMLPGELRALAPARGDVVAFSDSALDIRATIGVAIVCDTLPGGDAIALAPARAGALPPLASFTTTPQSGDIAVVYDVNAPARERDATWTTLEISAVSSSVALCATSPFVDPGSSSTPRIQLRFPGGARPGDSWGPGAFVRILRRVKYRFYRASTADWYLGYAEWDGTAFGVVQPVSGPFASYSRSGGSGLTLRYFDDQGAELLAGGDAAAIARVELTVRGAARDGLSAGMLEVDSQFIAVRVRNR